MPRGFISKVESYELSVGPVADNEFSNIVLTVDEVAYIQAADEFVVSYQRWVNALGKRPHVIDRPRVCAGCRVLLGQTHRDTCVWFCRTQLAGQGLVQVTADHCERPVCVHMDLPAEPRKPQYRPMPLFWECCKCGSQIMVVQPTGERICEICRHGLCGHCERGTAEG